MIHLADGKRTKLVNIENVKPYHEAPEKPVYNLERPEREKNSEDCEMEMGTERTHHVHFEERPEIENFDQADKTPEHCMFFKRGEGLAASQNFGLSEPSRRITRSQARRNTESEGREQLIMPQLCRARTRTETDTEEWTDMDLEEDVS